MKYIDRDLSWLSFNERILQEASSLQVPLLERLKFAAIYSSNLEEFYKVRVASHRFAQKYKGDKKNKYGYRPSYILQQISRIVGQQQVRLGKIFAEQIVPEMAAEGIHLLRDNFSSNDLELISTYFDDHLVGNFNLIEITEADRLELKNQFVYLYVLAGEKSYIIELDYKRWGRFVVLSDNGDERRIVQLDDVYKQNVHKIVPGGAEVYAVKISRDAELYIDEEQDDSIVRKIQKSIRKRDTGMPARLLFDEEIKFRYINELRKKIDVDMAGLSPGGRYHNFYDFFGFPAPDDKSHLVNAKPVKVPSARLDGAEDWFAAVRQQEVFLSFPYQEYGYVTEFLNRAADDPKVTEINITLYRVARESAVCQALERAAAGGKKVFVLSEVQARFDEESNIYWGERLEKAGATVSYGVKDLKVHAKIFTVHREEEGQQVTYSYLGTGNFNEKTAGIYGDHALITTREAYASELDKVFQFLKDHSTEPSLEHLLVAPFNLRSTLYDLIENEIRIAKEGREARMMIKLNSLEDLGMIDRVRAAANAGVKIDLVVRGICCYFPLNKKQARNIRVVSVVDQFLEHTRIYHFHNDGSPKTYLASADWMTRNLSRRIEVAFPIFDEKIRGFLIRQMELQLTDQLKGRMVAIEDENAFVSGDNNRPSQAQMFGLVADLELPARVGG